MTDIYEKLAVKILNHYDQTFPAAKQTMRRFSNNVVQPPHYVRTILGRKSRFKLWEEDVAFGKGDGKKYPLRLAQEKWEGNIRIADTYKAINRVLQGSAADIMKKGMLDAFEMGIFDKIGYPHATVHDELDLSYHPDLHKEFMELKAAMENAVKLSVPLLVSFEKGPNWGEVA